MDLLLKNIRGICVVKTPINTKRKNIPQMDILECVGKTGRFIIFPIHGSNCFYGYDKVNKWFEQFEPDREGFSPDTIFEVVINMSNFKDGLIDIGSVFTAEQFATKQHGYYYAYMRFKNPDLDRDEVIDIVRNIKNVNLLSFKTFTDDLEDVL